MGRSRPAPHERREQWVDVIGESFHRVTIWRASRDQYSELEVILSSMLPTCVELVRNTQQLLVGPRIAAFCNKFFQAVKAVYRGYRQIMDFLEDGHACIEDSLPKWTDPHFRTQKQNTIKRLVMFDHCTRAFAACLEEFEELDPFLAITQDLGTRRRPARRHSCSDIDIWMQPSTARRLKLEHILRDFARAMEKSLHQGLGEPHELYNNGRLFEEYVYRLQCKNDEEAEQWQASGMEYPYPSYSLQTSTMRISTRHYNRSEGSNRVPRWEDDEELRDIFS